MAQGKDLWVQVDVGTVDRFGQFVRVHRLPGDWEAGVKSAIYAENLCKNYGEIKAVDQVNLAVSPGLIFGFLGKNGAGKTTTIRLLTGLAKPSEGQAWVDGESILDGKNLACKIGYLPEEPAFYGWMTPIEYLDYVGSLFRLSKDVRKERINKLLDRLGLTGSAKRRIGGFSRGMRQRLGLAQALINEPSVLLLDEPASALDPSGRKEVLDMIVGLRGTHTVFMSTHILADAERVCDRIAIIDRGKILIEAAQQELRADFSVPVFEIESALEDQVMFSSWISHLESEPWIEDVQLTGAVGRVRVTDFDSANQALPLMVVNAGFTLTRYECVKPSLEDIFLRLVEKEES